MLTKMFVPFSVMYVIVVFITLTLASDALSRNDPKNEKNGGDLALWIDEKQVKMFSGMSMEIYAIVNGNVLPYILDPNFEKYLPIIPSEVSYVNFTWKSGMKKYYYNFDRLQSFDEAILEAPIISIKTKGRVPKRPKEFSILLPCLGNSSGIAAFGIGLLIESRKGRPLNGTPLRLKLRKECSQRGPDPECDKKCANHGWCNHEKICQCPEGYMGQYCRTALCYPQCMNGGNCTSPGVCSCPVGFQGRHCEGGICSEKCENGGKCVQKDTCECSKGFYGLRCEYSKCVIPCLNGGKCRGVNKCRCLSGFRGDHCEIEQTDLPKR
ncbi:shifted [Carabus blaptoides fortunei]